MNRNSPWINTKLGNVLEQILGGGTPSKSVAEYWDNGNIPWATVKDMAEGKYALYDTKDHITEAGVKNSATRIIPKGTVIISTRMGLGRCFINKVDMAINQDLKALVPKKELVDTKFLLWLYASKAQTVDNLGTGTTVKGIRIEQLKNIDISLPPLFTQRKIAAILSAYDDLIENNTRRIKILEEMAQTLYREWFVKFRFPGHERVRMVESEVGMIPEGWKVRNFEDVAVNFDSKRKPLSSMQRASMQGQYPYYGAAKVLDHVNDYIFNGKYLLIAEDGSVITPDGNPVLQFVNEAFWVNNHAHIVQGKYPVSTEFLYLFLSNFKIAGYITGSAQPKFTQANLNRIKVPVAPDGIFEVFNRLVEDLFSQMLLLRRKNTILRRTRDLLLPKLISGELDVEDLDIAVGGD